MRLNSILRFLRFAYVVVAALLTITLRASAQPTYTVTDLGTLGGSESRTIGINASGQVVGNSSTSDAAGHAFLYSGGVMKDLGTLGGTGSVATGINASGQVIGTSTTGVNQVEHAFLYSGVAMKDLGTLGGGTSSFATGINASGQVVGESTLGGSSSGHAFLYSDGVMKDLGTLGGTSSFVRGINASGQVIGNSTTADFFSFGHAFVYSGGAMKDLNDLIDPTAGWVLDYAAAINDKGQIVGRGTINGENHAFLLTPRVPFVVTPNTGARPHSNFVVLTGIGEPNRAVLLRDNTTNLIIVYPDSNGAWETVLNIGSGSHSITAEYFDDPSTTSDPTVVTPNPGLTPAPHIFTDYSKLRKTDVILCRSNVSPQIKLYGPTYSHVALYLGGDSDGTPLIAEAVTSAESRGLGPVRTVPLEWSTVYSDDDVVDFFRPVNALTESQKSAIVTWTLATTSRSLPYWNTIDLGKVLLPRTWWSATLHQPTFTARFNAALVALDDTTRSTDKYICSTLVWQAYQQGGIDLSTPNNARIGGILTGLDPAYVDRIRPFFVFPDTIFYCGKLAQVK